jgi:DNA-binding GntR family transcriptional regulator
MTPFAPELDEAFSRELLSDQVYRRIRRSILRLEIQPGERLVESEIARRYKISQAPVREAIKRLVHEGLVTYAKRRGSYVAQISDEEAAQARRTRAVIERLAAHETVGRLTADDRELLTSSIERIRTCAKADDLIGVRDADVAFHRQVCIASNNPFLPRMWALLEPSLYTLRAISDPFLAGDMGAMAASHERLLDALLAGDPEHAGMLFAEHASGKSGMSPAPPA